MPSPTIEPRTLKGFRDYLPETMIPREEIIDTARRVFRSYGFSPIDTPALEYLDILAGKGGDESDKQLYRFQDHGGRDVGLRFDLTVPLARFAAQHINDLGTPFKRYHIASVWRGENPQTGRYREFMQCDFDTVGTNSPVADVETALVIHDLLRAIGIPRFTISINNRRVLGGLLKQLGLGDRTTQVLRSLDKLAKIGPNGVGKELEISAQASPDQVRQVLEFSTLSGTNDEVLAQATKLVAGTAEGQQGLDQLAFLWSAVQAAGVPSERVRVDVSLARGLDYYTGTVYETILDDLPQIGSVCSGGRYDNLASLYTNVELPGVGASLGLDRLLAAMQELGMIEPVRTPADVFIAYFDADRLDDYLRLGSWLRAAGLGVEVYPESKKLGKQLQYADRRGFRVALVIGPDEFAAGQCQIKDLGSGQSVTAPLADEAKAVVDEIQSILAD